MGGAGAAGSRPLPRVDASAAPLSASVSARLQVSTRDKRESHCSAFSRVVPHPVSGRKTHHSDRWIVCLVQYIWPHSREQKKEINSLLGGFVHWMLIKCLRVSLHTGSGFVPSQHPGQAGPDHLLPDRRRGRGRDLHQRGGR